MEAQKRYWCPDHILAESNSPWNSNNKGEINLAPLEIIIIKEFLCFNRL